MNAKKGHVPARTGVTLVLMRKLPIAVRDFITLAAAMPSASLFDLSLSLSLLLSFFLSLQLHFEDH